MERWSFHAAKALAVFDHSPIRSSPILASTGLRRNSMNSSTCTVLQDWYREDIRNVLSLRQIDVHASVIGVSLEELSLDEVIDASLHISALGTVDLQSALQRLFVSPPKNIPTVIGNRSCGMSSVNKLL